MTEAATGSQCTDRKEEETGFESARVAAYLQANAVALQGAGARTAAADLRAALERTALRLGQLGQETTEGGQAALDDLDRHLGVLEEQLHAAVVAALPEEELLALREDADRELAPLRGRMEAGHLRSVRESLLQKRILGAHGIPRLSLFYMPLDGDGGGEAAA